MIKRLIKRFTCRHYWTRTYIELSENTYTCNKCGNASNVRVWNDGTWRIRQEIRGGAVE